jgi:hypothetical protein
MLLICHSTNQNVTDYNSHQMPSAEGVQESKAEEGKTDFYWITAILLLLCTFANLPCKCMVLAYVIFVTREIVIKGWLQSRPTIEVMAAGFFIASLKYPDPFPNIRLCITFYLWLKILALILQFASDKLWVQLENIWYDFFSSTFDPECQGFLEFRFYFGSEYANKLTRVNVFVRFSARMAHREGLTWVCIWMPSLLLGLEGVLLCMEPTFEIGYG